MPEIYKFYKLGHMDFNSKKAPFTKAYLKDYERKIRRLPLVELYDILTQIEDHPFNKDPSPERINIVKKRIRELEPEALKKEEEKEAFHAKVVEEYEKNRGVCSILLDIITWVSLFSSLIYQTTEDSNKHTLCLILSCALFAMAGSAILVKMVPIKCGRIYKAENPFLFKITVAMYLFFATGFMAYGISGTLRIV